VRCFDDTDFERLFNYQHNEEVDSPIYEEARKEAKHSIGRFLDFETATTSKYVFSVEKAKRTQKKEGVTDIFIHEQQHAINALFTEPIGHDSLDNLLEGKVGEERRHILLRYMRLSRLQAESLVKDEILSFFRDGSSSEDIIQLLASDARSYDFLTETKDSFRSEFFKEDLRRNKFISTDPSNRNSREEEVNKDIEILIDQVFEKEYRALVTEAINLCFMLVKEGWSVSFIISLFQREPISRWKKVTRRLLESNTVA